MFFTTAVVFGTLAFFTSINSFFNLPVRRINRNRITITPRIIKATNTPYPSPTKFFITPTFTPTPTLNNQGDEVKLFMMNEINNWRKSQGLSDVRTDPYTCGFAKTRAGEISQELG